MVLFNLGLYVCVCVCVCVHKLKEKIEGTFCILAKHFSRKQNII